MKIIVNPEGDAQPPLSPAILVSGILVLNYRHLDDCGLLPLHFGELHDFQVRGILMKRDTNSIDLNSPRGPRNTRFEFMIEAASGFDPRLYPINPQKFNLTSEK